MSHHIHHTHHINHKAIEAEKAQLPVDIDPPQSRWHDELFANSANQNAREECKATAFHMSGRSLVESLNFEPLEGCGGHGQASAGKQGNAAAESVSPAKAVAQSTESQATAKAATESQAKAKAAANSHGDANSGHKGGQASGHCGHGGNK